MKILIIERSVPIIDRMENLILDIDRTLTVYKTGKYEDAMKLFFDVVPDVVLLDMNFSGNRSQELLKQLKDAGKSCIIALSNQVSLAIMEQCKQQGADYFLDKYNEFEKIPDLIRARCKAS